MFKKFLFSISLLLFSFSALAQVRDTDLVLGLSPQYPAPNQNVIATLNSYVLNLDKANISWSVNGEENANGIGKKNFSFKVGNLGSNTEVVASINTLDGQTIEKKIIIAPTDIDLLWEAVDSYAPPFYKGKSLTPNQGTFKVVALPSITTNGANINPNNLSYKWERDGNGQPDSSGWGKSSYVFRHSYLDKNNEVQVEVSDISSNINTGGKIILYTADPKIVFYKKDSLFGTDWNNALSSPFSVGENGDTLVAEPYFFSPKNINASELAFDWSINGENITTPNPKNILSIKKEAGQTGVAKIKVVISNVATLFQEMAKTLDVNF